MKFFFKTIMLCFLISSPHYIALAETIPLVEINIDVKNHGKNAKIIFNNLEKPFTIHKNGKATFYAYEEDSLNIKIYCPGFKVIDFNVYPNTKIKQNHPFIKYSADIKVDYQEEMFYGQFADDETLYSMEAIDPPSYWIAGRISEKYNGKEIPDVLVGLFQLPDMQLRYNNNIVSNSNGGFCIPVFNRSEGFLISETIGYSTGIHLLTESDFEKIEQPQSNSNILIKNFELDLINPNRDYVTFVPYLLTDRHLALIDKFEIVYSYSPDRKQQITDRILVQAFPNISNIDIGFFNKSYGMNRVTMDVRKDSLHFLPLYGNPDAKSLNSIFSNLFFFQLKEVKALKRLNISKFMVGTNHFSGVVLDKKSGRILPNAIITIDGGERITNSDGMGKFEFKNVSSKKHMVHIQRKGYRSSKFILEIDKNIYKNIELFPTNRPPKGSFHGELLSYFDSKPVIQKELTLLKTNYSVITDSSGIFEFNNLPEGSYSLSVVGNENSMYDFYIAPDTSIEKTLYHTPNRGFSESIKYYEIPDLKQYMKGSISGTVIDEKTKECIRAVAVYLKEIDYLAHTDVQGEFMFQNVPTGTYSLLFHSKRYQSLKSDKIAHDAELFSRSFYKLKRLEKGEKAETLFVKQFTPWSGVSISSRYYSSRFSFAQIEGNVFDNQRIKPIHGATIRIKNFNYETKSDEDGYFLLSPIDIKGYYNSYELLISCPGYKDLTHKFRMKNNSLLKCSIAMLPDGSLPVPKVFSPEVIDDISQDELLQKNQLGVIISRSQNFKSQYSKIVGKVIDDVSEEPIIGANIFIEGTSRGAATGLEGDFVIVQILPASYKLKASAIGFSTVELDINTKPGETIECLFRLIPDQKSYYH